MNSSLLACTPMLPVTLILFAKILSAAVAIQYAPDAPLSRMTATVVLFVSFSAVAISSVATGVPPGLSISSSIAFMSSFSAAFSINSTIVSLFVPGVNESSFVWIIPSIGMTAMFPVASSDGMNEPITLKNTMAKIRNNSVLIPMLIIFQVFLRICPPVNSGFVSFFGMSVFS